MKISRINNVYTMKKNLFLVTVFLFITSITCYAQGYSSGFRIGANISSITSDDIPDNLKDHRIGLMVGFFTEFYIDDYWSFQPELQYSSLGNKEEALQIDYIQIPLFIKRNLSQTFNVQIGPQIGLKIWEWEDNVGVERNFNTFNFTAVAGLGMNISANFFADVRYGFGFSDILDESQSAPNARGSTRNIQLSVGYRL